jgi:hypothetical protein
LREQVRGLRTLLVAALLASLLLSVGVDAFLFIQDHLVRKDLKSLSAAKDAIHEYETSKRPLINSFVSQLQVYAQNHPDFKPILEKYGIKAPSPSAAPGPAPKPGNKSE